MLPLEDRHGEAWLREIGVAEVLVHPESRLLNRTIRESEFRTRFDVLVMGMRRKGEAVREDQPAVVRSLSTTTGRTPQSSR